MRRLSSGTIVVGWELDGYGGAQLAIYTIEHTRSWRETWSSGRVPRMDELDGMP